MADNIIRPAHYMQGNIECIEYIMDHDFNFNLGNVIKYVTRAGHKKGNSTLQDLRKARQYLEFEIAWLESMEEEDDSL